MSTITIKTNPYQEKIELYVDGEPISPFSEFNNYVRQPLVLWANKLMDTAERELNDDFNICVCGVKFERQFLYDMQKDADCCLNYQEELYPLDYSVEKRLDMLKNISEKYHINTEKCYEKMAVYSEISGVINPETMIETSKEKAFLIILNEPAEMPEQPKRTFPYIVLSATGNNRVVCRKDGGYIWEIEQSRFDDVLDAIVEYCVMIPWLREMSFCYTKEDIWRMSEDDIDTLLYSVSTNYKTFVDIPAKMERTEEFTPIAYTTPVGFQPCPVIVESSDEDILFEEDGIIYALSTGISTITVRNSITNEIISQREVTVTESHLQVEDIVELEVGEYYTPVVTSRRAEENNVSYRIETNLPEILEINGRTIKVLEEAEKICLLFYETGKRVPFALKVFSAYKERYVKGIKILTEAPILRVGQSVVFEAFPDLTEFKLYDENRDIWEIDDDSVAIIPEYVNVEGDEEEVKYESVRKPYTCYFVAINPGKAKVTVKTKYARATVDITVIPDAEIKFSATHINMYQGDTYILETYVGPWYDIKWVAEEPIVSLQALGDHKLQITAIKPGKTNIRCFDPHEYADPNKGAVCSIVVEGPLKRASNALLKNLIDWI